MIVKNEADLLARCLASVRPVADQIVVVDTGSTDRTVDVARAAGAEVVRAEWRDDFAWARNISLDHARCAWILWLDADDVVPQESVAKLAQLKKEKPDRVFGLIVRNERPNNTGTEFVQARMFPNRPELRFERRVHEQMMPSALRLGLEMEKRGAVIEHHGYADPEALKRKSGRNIGLMLAEWDERDPDPVTAVEIADSYQLVDNIEEAEKWYRKVLAVPRIEIFSPSIASQAYNGLGAICNQREAYGKAVEFLTDAVRLAPWRTDALYALAVSHDMAGSPGEAIGCLRRILQAEPSPGQVGVDFRAARLKAALRLLRILTEQKRFNETTAEIQKALSCWPDRPEIALMAGKALLAAGNLVEAVRLFEKSVTLAREKSMDSFIGLCIIYGKAGRMETAQQTMDSIKALFEKSVRYWAFNKYFFKDGTIRGEFTEKDLEKEWNTIKREFFGQI